MFLAKVSLLISFLVLANIYCVEGSFKERDKVLYKDLGTLYFSPGEKTRARRTYSVPQLVCMKGCHYPQPKVVQCTNTGWDGSSNLWKCKSDLDSNYMLDNVEIVCEGYNSPDDPYVTVGSCSLEYSIKPKKGSGGGFGDSGIIFIIFCLLLIFILYKTCLSPSEEVRQNSTTNDDRPDDGHGPQMGWNIPGMNQRRGPGHTPGRGYGFMPQGDTCGNQGNAGGGGGGFWTGLATGGVLGYLFSGNRDRNTGYRNMHGSSSFSNNDWTSRGSSGLFSSEDNSSNSESVSTARYRQR